MIEGYDRYQEEVGNGKVVCCLEVRQAIARQARDLSREDDSDFPYYFDRKEAERVLTFMSLMRCTGGEWKGKRLQLADFQCWRNAVLFGWLRKEDGYRRFRIAYIEVARKQGKSEEASAVSNYGLLADGEESAQIYSAATTRQQAKIVFKSARIMLRELIKESPALKKRVQLLANRVVDNATDSYMEALSSDAWTLDGLSPHISIVDELHAHPTDEVLEVLETGMGARTQPMLYMITTAGYNMQGPCYQMRKTAKNILAGVVEDESFFAIIYTLDDDDDWKDEKNWVKANPNIGVTPKWAFMQAQFTKAKTRGKTAEVGFKTKNLNIWVGSQTGWIKDEAWMACPNEIDLERLRGKVCYGGLDLASTSDFTALCLFFPGGEEEPHTMLWFYWLPEETFEERWRQTPSMLEWRDAGHIEVTPGNVTDYDYVLARAEEVTKMYDVQMIGCDPYNAKQLIVQMQTAGLPVQEFSQGIMMMSGPTKEFERLAMKGDINHGGNPVTRWMLGNVHLYKDAKDNIQVHKGKSTEKVDGIVAGIIAIGEWMTMPVKQKSYLENNDLMFL